MKIDMNGDFEVKSSVDETFAFITSPNDFAPVLPFFKELRSMEDRSFVVVLEIGVPQVRGKAEVTVQTVETLGQDKVLYTMNGRHALGMIDARMTFVLAGTTVGTKVTWTSEGVVSGTLASLAQGILLPIAKRQIKSLVMAVQQRLGAVDAAPEADKGLLRRSMSSMKGLFGGRPQVGSGENAP